MADIKILLPYILSFEGGFSNHPADKGGATNKGVTLTNWKSQGYDKDGDGDIDVQDLKLITDKDVCDYVLRPHYWNRWKADQIKDQSIANLVVDWTYNSGSHGITKVQQILGVTVDGKVGPKTLAALNGYPDQQELFIKIWNRRWKFYDEIVARSPSQRVFLKGWRRRLSAIAYGALTYNNGGVHRW